MQYRTRNSLHIALDDTFTNLPVYSLVSFSRLYGTLQPSCKTDTYGFLNT